MPPKKRKRTEKEIVIENYNLDEVKATKEWTQKTFKILNTRIKGDTLEEKAVEILRAQNITTAMTKAHLLKEDEGKLRLRKIIGDGGIDLFGEIVIQNQTLQWIAQCKMTKQLENSTINEMKGLLSSRPNTIGIIIHGGNKSRQIESMIETANSDIFVCHIEELHMIRNQIEAKSIQQGIRTIAMTRMKVEEMEEVEFDIFGRITKAKRIKNIDIQTWGSHNLKRKGTIRMEYPMNEINNSKRRHLNWKEKRRERALRWKALRTGLTKEERIELEDLNFVEVIAKGRSIQ
ncbi:hypothetical protein Glove_21g241 [Diversispora epigaea]|uniref:Uncharacterized protein n=1 Tax=Diversispora epigaea TaxID=1348612 RepID=A0A397JJW5_9GLOM|nr:hypothetical protein Glove_21g241 [Diversispora epigaea]